MDKKSPQQKYNLAHRVQVKVDMYLPSEQELYDYLQRQPNKAGYIKQLIRKDMQESAN